MVDESKLLIEENFKKWGYTQRHENIFVKKTVIGYNVYFRCSNCSRFGEVVKISKLGDRLQYTCRYCELNHDFELKGKQQLRIINKEDLK